MTPFAIMGWCFAIVFVTVALPWVFSRRKAEKNFITDVSEIPVEHRYRDGGTVGFRGPDDSIERVIGKHPALGAPYKREGYPKTMVTLNPRQLERVNTQRKLRGKPPLNRAGFANAIAHAHPYGWSDTPRQPTSTNDWLTYLILYECLFAGHQSPTVACGGYVTIDPNMPYNGQGGEFAGAGASGNWTDPDGLKTSGTGSDTYQPGDTVGGYGAGAGLNDDSGGPASAPSDPGPIPGGDGGYPQSSPASSDGPGPSYSAPDPSPSSDSGSSYSSSSDSGSSGGSDGGGSSGGSGE